MFNEWIYIVIHEMEWLSYMDTCLEQTKSLKNETKMKIMPKIKEAPAAKEI